MTMVYTFLADTLTADIADHICIEVTRFNFKPVLEAIPAASDVMFGKWCSNESIRRNDRAFIERYGAIKNDERFEPLLDRLVDLTENLTDIIVTADSLSVTIMDILETQFGDINKFRDFIQDQIVYWHGIFVSEQEYYIENPPDPLSDDDD